MSGTMKTLPFAVLLKWILKEYAEQQSIFGIHRSLFYTPKKDSPYATADMFGQYLATPIGPAAGPHTQLAQNIISAWLSGSRLIELKTVQVMDNLEVAKPCIDMEDEGYNVEWSQELQLEHSANEYIKAWVLIHVLHRLLGFEEKVPLGTIFNFSIGYNLEGITSPKMARFMSQIADASEEISEIQAILNAEFPRFAGLEIPSQLSNNVTLSTMHGCPPDEIEQLARYLLVEKSLHTTVKLNPTLLGKNKVISILHDHLGYHEIQIHDAVFEHDLQYDRAVEMIKKLKLVSTEQNLTFSIKLSNTLAMANHKGVIPGDEMYMSGRALYPITINLFHKLAQEFKGDINVSYSAGADALNLTTILASGAKSVNVASDLLKPGGYSRLLQYLENLAEDMFARNVSSLPELALNKLNNLEQAAADALTDPRYKKQYHPYGLPKVDSALKIFDCITAPCMEQCAVTQDVPGYIGLIAQGEYNKALKVILARNPLPAMTGYMCTHLCETRCTRNNYDEPVAIRALKRFADLAGSAVMPVREKTKRKVAVIGSGPAGLAAAYHLASNGVQVTVYEAKQRTGGMPAIAPAFRIPSSVTQKDVDRIIGMGVEIKLSHPITGPPEELLKEGFDAVYIASGFPKDALLNIAGIEAKGVITALELLERVAQGERPDLGTRVLVIGGGNTAMDAARTARRLTGKPVTVVYRRTEKEMPAIKEEREMLFAEGNILKELASPIRVILKDNFVIALECVRNELGEPDADGRCKPIEIKGSEFELKADSIVVAIGQTPDGSFLDDSAVSRHRNGAIQVNSQSGMTDVSCVYAGGDAVHGPASIVQACADGRRAAQSICTEFGISFELTDSPAKTLSETDLVALKRARVRKEVRSDPKALAYDQNRGFDLVEQTYTEETARKEATRCLQCAAFCDKCIDVCPNRANYAFLVPPLSIKLPYISCRNGVASAEGEESFQVQQRRQIIHVDDFCNECGNCAVFCVHQGKPYIDKPRLFLSKSDYEREENNAFHINGNTMLRREGSRESRLIIERGSIVFENDHIQLSLSPAYEVREVVLKSDFTGNLSIKEVAETALIFNGIIKSLPFLIIPSLVQ